jgi:5-(aminomethyl)-3-furanmethanol phosphate kinase
MRTVVLKVGGSLFDLRDLGPRLERVLALVDADRKLLFPGGGPTADLVRDWHRRFVLSEEQSHWLAIEALDLNGQLLTRIVPHARWALDAVMLNEHARRGQTSVLLPARFLSWPEQDALADDAPPHVWDVTSDTLAAWTAIRWPADELVLLKSVPCPVGRTAVEAVQAGLVDAYFPGYAGRLPRVSWCCLRDDEPRVVPWLEQGRP